MSNQLPVLGKVDTGSWVSTLQATMNLDYVALMDDLSKNPETSSSHVSILLQAAQLRLRGLRNSRGARGHSPFRKTILPESLTLDVGYRSTFRKGEDKSPFECVLETLAQPEIRNDSPESSPCDIFSIPPEPKPCERSSGLDTQTFEAAGALRSQHQQRVGLAENSSRKVGHTYGSTYISENATAVLGDIYNNFDPDRIWTAIETGLKHMMSDFMERMMSDFVQRITDPIVSEIGRLKRNLKKRNRMIHKMKKLAAVNNFVML